MRGALSSCHRVLTALAVGLILTAPTGAQEADKGERLQAATELIELLKLEEVTTQSIDMMMESMLAQDPALQDFRDVFEDFFDQHFRWDELEPEYVRIYADAYTESELRELIAFYQTPVGRKTVDLMPVLMRQGAAIGERQIQPHLPELQKRIMQRMMDQMDDDGS